MAAKRKYRRRRVGDVSTDINIFLRRQIKMLDLLVHPIQPARLQRLRIYRPKRQRETALIMIRLNIIVGRIQSIALLVISEVGFPIVVLF
jgi:hypothetical protein